MEAFPKIQEIKKNKKSKNPKKNRPMFGSGIDVCFLDFWIFWISGIFWIFGFFGILDSLFFV